MSSDNNNLPVQETKEPIAALSLEEYEENDPWATQPENNALLMNEEGRDSDQQDSDYEQEQLAIKENLPQQQQQQQDNDTSAAKGFQNFHESDSIDDLIVHGHLPEWLTGEYFTVGPATFDIKYLRKMEIDGELQNVTALYTFGHWFDALPLVNRFDLNGPRNMVTYRSRSTSRRLLEKIRERHGYAPQHPNGLYMSSTNQSVLTKIMGSSKSLKPDAVPCGARVLADIPGIDGRLFAQNHANHMQELDPFDLKPTRVFSWSDINPKFKGTSSCPNGQFDSRTGEYINFTMEVGYQSVSYNFFSISDRNPKGSIIASVTAPMAHVNTFSLTPKYIIFVICPMLADSGGMKYNWHESIMDSFSFNSSEPTLFYVISREQGQVVATYRSDPCFVFNHINAFEDDRGTVYLDMICYADDTIARQLTTEYLRNPSSMKPARLAASEVRRYVLANIEEEKMSYLTNSKSIPSKGNVLSSLFGGKKKTSNDSKWYSWMPIASFDKRAEPAVELPQINPNWKLKQHSFMYGLTFSVSNSLQDGALWDSIVKINMDTKQIVASWHQDFCYPSEAVFIPKPDGQEEDEGVLISVVMDSSKSTSFLLVLDSKTLNVLATADLERLVPLSFAHHSYRLLQQENN